MDTLLQDFRYGLRMLAKRPGITAVAVLSLGLGIGANTTIFTVIRGVFLTPIPVRDASSLVEIYTEDVRGMSFQFAPNSYLNSRDYREQNTVLEDLTTFAGLGNVALRAGEQAAAESVPSQLVTGNYFDVLGVRAAAGRLFSFPAAEDDRLGAHPEVVLSYALAERLFGSPAAAIGQTVRLNAFPFTVVGVTAEGFKGTQSIAQPEQVWVHVSMRAQVLPPRFAAFFEGRRPLIAFNIGRLRPGVTLPQAQAEFTAIAQRLAEAYPEANGGRTARVVPFSPVNPNQRGAFVGAGALLMVVVGLVLLIACANVANLLLARALEREKEIAVRLALGARRGRLVRQLLTESLLLALLGGGAGLLIAVWGRDLLWSFRPPFLQGDAVDLTLDPLVLAFTAGVALATGLLFGLVPSLQASRPRLRDTLQEGGRRGVSGSSKLWLRRALVVAEVSLAVVALVGAGLFVRSMRNAQRVDPGFDPDNLFVMFLNTTSAGYDLPRATEFFDTLLERVERLGGVQSAALSQNFPLGGGFLRSVFPEGRDLDPDERVLTTTNPISPGYFDTLGIPLLRGRNFEHTDDERAPWVAIVNEAMAAHFWPGEDPLGKRFQFFASPNDPYYRQPIEIVGLVADKRIALGQPPQPIVYMPYRQWMSPGWVLNVRAAPGALEATMGEVQALVRRMEPALPITALTTAEDNLAQQLWAPRMGAGLLTLFGALAVLLACVGLYGVMANAVDQRAHEMGIRMALGADRRQVIGLIVRHGMGLVAAGLVLGWLIALRAASGVEGMLFDVPARDPLTFLAVGAVLAVVALVATYLPARRLSRLDPAMALRAE